MAHQEKSTGLDSSSYSYSYSYSSTPCNSNSHQISKSESDVYSADPEATLSPMCNRNPSMVKNSITKRTYSVLAPSFVLFFTVAVLFLFATQWFLSPSSSSVPVLKDTNKPGASASDGWNLLYHLGGNGPWIPRVDDVVEGGIDSPAGCKVDQVHMMSRHGERYPTGNAGQQMIALVERIKSSGRELKGSLAFINHWEFFSGKQQLEQLTSTGPYAGTLQAFGTGVKLRTRYHRLWNDTTPHPPPTVFWASESERVINTAKYFGAGFFGLEYEESERAKLEIISEDEDKGGNTLTPGDTCTKYRQDTEKGHDLGEKKLSEYRSTYLPAISQRLEKENPGFEFTDPEIYSMQEICGFETLVRGNSPWCAIFTETEWLQFEYARDVIHYFRTGPGNPYSMAMGWLWLNTTANLIQKGPEITGPLFLSFVHDGDIIPMLASLGLFTDPETLPLDKIYHDRRWKTSQIVPMGGRLIFERMTCSAGSGESPDSEAGVFIRFNVNDGIVALDGCDSGPGKSCPLERFMQHVQERGELGGDFRKVCGLPEWAPDRPTFLRQPGRVHA